MNHICTWLCVDDKGEESVFPQTGMLSSLQRHQDIYWRCVLVFFSTSRRLHKTQKHILFTNTKALPVVDGVDISNALEMLEVEVIYTGFDYKTPKGYYGQFQNQFYEFSILEHISKTNHNSRDLYLLLDSDCIFIKPADELFRAASATGFISFEDDVKPEYIINGLSRNDLKDIYAELLGRSISAPPSYHLGEFLLCSVENIKKISNDFVQLWPVLLERHKAGLKKLNEEAHTLSFLYFKHDLTAAGDNPFMKRIWTNPAFYRNVSRSDLELCIWHLPAEKTFGLHTLYKCFTKKAADFGRSLGHDEFMSIVTTALGIPHLSMGKKLHYYARSYYRAVMKRL